MTYTFTLDGTSRSKTLIKLWARLNEISDITEDKQEMINLIQEAGLAVPVMHSGVPPEDFTPEMVAEWAITNWYSILANKDDWWMLNTARNVSHTQYQKLVDMLETEVPSSGLRDGIEASADL
jgi:hypothetical protein